MPHHQVTKPLHTIMNGSLQDRIRAQWQVPVCLVLLVFTGFGVSNCQGAEPARQVALQADSTKASQNSPTPVQQLRWKLIPSDVEPSIRSSLLVLPQKREAATPEQLKSGAEKSPSDPEDLGEFQAAEEIEHQIATAQQVSKSRPDLAIPVWQRLLQQSASALASSSDSQVRGLTRRYVTFTPLHEKVVRSIIAAGPETVAACRLQMEGPARALLQKEEIPRKTLLKQVSERYPFAPSAQTALFELACLSLEDGEWGKADQALKLLSLIPDGVISREDIATRRFVAALNLKKSDQARELLDRSANLPTEVKALLEKELAVVRSHPDSKVNRRGTGSSIELSTPALQAAWSVPLDWKRPESSPPVSGAETRVVMLNGRRVVVAIGPGNTLRTLQAGQENHLDMSAGDFLKLWGEKGVQPAFRPVIAEGKVWGQAPDAIRCLDLKTGQILWAGRPTSYVLSFEETIAAVQAQNGFPDRNGPRNQIGRRTSWHTETGIRIFHDPVFQSMVVAGDRLVVVEGPLKSNQPVEQEKIANQVLGPAELMGQNELAAYDKNSGKLLWNRGQLDANSNATVMISPPYVIGEHVHVVTLQSGVAEVNCLDLSDGRLVWRSPLPHEVSPAGARIAADLCHDNGLLFVVTGGGALVAMDQGSGAIQWLTAYPRTELETRFVLSFEGETRKSGPKLVADMNRVFCHNGLVIVLASDSADLMAFHAADGRLAWDSPLFDFPRSGSRNVIGMNEEHIFLEDQQSVWAVRLNGGRMVWRQTVSEVTGRGLLLENAVLIPGISQLTVLDPATGEVTRTIPVDSGTNKPVGNLLTDGEALYQAGALDFSRLTGATTESTTSGSKPAQQNVVSPEGSAP